MVFGYCTKYFQLLQKVKRSRLVLLKFYTPTQSAMARTAIRCQ